MLQVQHRMQSVLVVVLENGAALPGQARKSLASAALAAGTRAHLVQAAVRPVYLVRLENGLRLLA